MWQVYGGSMKITLGEYHRTEGMSKGKLDKLAISPLHYKHSMKAPPYPTPQMILGAAYHLKALEPNAFDKYYVVAPEINRRTKDGKEQWAEFEKENEGKTVLEKEELTLIDEMIAELYKHPTAKKLLSGGVAEDSLFAEIDGVKAKCRPDYKREDLSCLIDLKTTIDASWQGFSRAISNFNYHIQAAWYLDVASLAEQVKYEQFVFICQEKKPPYAIAIYVADNEMVEIGREKYQELLQTYQHCKDNDVWPGYPQVVQVISLPPWATK
jgi:exodeoxyribonuclease VIII